MKTLYELEIPKEVEVSETETTHDAQNNEIKTTKKVKKMVGQKFFIKYPTNSLRDDGNIFYCKTESFLKRQGIDSISDIEKRLQNQGGILSEPEKELRKTLVTEGLEIQKKLDELIKIKEEDRTEKEKLDVKDFSQQLGEVLKKLQVITDKINDAYKNTVETITTNKMVLWWLLMLSYKEEDNKQKPVFGNGTFEERKISFDELEERENEFDLAMIKRLMLVISAWIYGGATTKQEFDSWLLVADNQKILNNLPLTEEVKQTP